MKNDTPPNELTTLSNTQLVFHVDRQTQLGFIMDDKSQWLFMFPDFVAVNHFPEGTDVYRIVPGGIAALIFEGRDALLSNIYAFTPTGPRCVQRPLQRENFAEDYQYSVAAWTLRCFDHAVKDDKEERCHRYYEESTELVHASGYTREQAHAMVDYVFDRPIGDLPNEVGGASVTLAALCEANGVDMVQATIDEITNIESNTDKIRTKWREKPAHIKGPTAKES